MFVGLPWAPARALSLSLPQRRRLRLSVALRAQPMPAPTPIQRKKSLPDVQGLPHAVEAMSREEVSILSSARREEVRRIQEESERLRANPLLYLVSPQVRCTIARMVFTSAAGASGALHQHLLGHHVLQVTDVVLSGPVIPAIVTATITTTTTTITTTNTTTTTITTTTSTTNTSTTTSSASGGAPGAGQCAQAVEWPPPPPPPPPRRSRRARPLRPHRPSARRPAAAASAAAAAAALSRKIRFSVVKHASSVVITPSCKSAAYFYAKRLGEGKGAVLVARTALSASKRMERVELCRAYH
ncbi:uncharacterized protein GBIM_03856 [Gryllus bimaculatus]|nr:uncharacterized protein GBIM_03856 [Gryllus bimaculatus]